MVRKAKTNPQTQKLLTEVELELMRVLWRLGEGSVADVMAALPKERNLAYTSVSTILRILEQKEVLQTRKEGRGHIYIPQITKSDYEAKTIKHMMTNVFEGAPVALVKQLLTAVAMNEAELKDLRDLIENARSKK